VTRFASEYVAHVLRENFEDARPLFLQPLLSVHYAHLVMLARCGIVSPEAARRLRDALDGVAEDQVGRAAFDGTSEDLYSYVECLVAGVCGAEDAGRLHTARSRNDIDVTMYRMRLRASLLDAIDAALDLRRTLLDLAAQHVETVFPAHTHTQPAQPTTLAHYLLAAIEQLERDTVRLRAALATTNVNPLGACALAGTAFPIDRELTSALLGFAGPDGNTYGSIAAVDYLVESTSALAVLLVGLGRLLQDLLLWCTVEFQYLRLPDGFVQGSTIMPQKRNPVALEHARAIASRALGEAGGVMVAVHNLPFGEVVDTEDDLQPLVHAAFRDATRAVRVTAACLRGAEVNRDTMEARAGANWITATELADTLTREHGLSFGRSHEVVGSLIAARARDPEAPLSRLLADLTAALPGGPLRYTDVRLRELLSPSHFVRVRSAPGGPAPAETTRALTVSSAALAADRQWLSDTRAALDAAARRLREQARAL
jgi:argininosuccinate lyase